MRMFGCALLGLALLANVAFAKEVVSGDQIAIQDMVLTVPDGWALSQDAKDNGTILLGFKSGQDYLNLYVKQDTNLNMNDIFVNDSQVRVPVRTMPRNSYSWKVLETSKRRGNSNFYITSFMTEVNGFTYFGYARTASARSALANVNSFLENLD